MLDSTMIDGHAGLHLTYLVMSCTAVRLFTFREMTERHKLYQLLTSAQTIPPQFSLCSRLISRKIICFSLWGKKEVRGGL